MATYAALLRGVNVGGRNPLPMADLRRLLEDLGHRQVRTYLQSGNAVLTAADADPASVAEAIQAAVSAHLGRPTTVMLRTPDELAAVVAANPLPQAEQAPTKVHVAFLAEAVPAERWQALDTARFAPDELHPGTDVAYVWYPNGAGRSKLTGAVLERALGVAVTARNWRSVIALLALVREAEAEAG